MRSTKQRIHPRPPQWKEKEELQVQPDRYYFSTLTLHSETGGDADLLGPHAIAGCTDIHTAVLTPRHHTVRQGGQLAVHLRPVGSTNQPHCGCGSAIAGSTVKRHSLGVKNHLVALVTVQYQRDLAGWVWNVSRNMLANTHVLNTCGITTCNTNVYLKHVMQMSVSKLMFYAQSTSAVISGRYKCVIRTRNTNLWFKHVIQNLMCKCAPTINDWNKIQWYCGRQEVLSLHQ